MQATNTKSYADCSWGFLGDRPVCIAVGETDSTRQGTDDSFNGRLKKSEMATNSNKRERHGNYCKKQRSD